MDDFSVVKDSNDFYLKLNFESLTRQPTTRTDNNQFTNSENNQGGSIEDVAVSKTKIRTSVKTRNNSKRRLTKEVASKLSKSYPNLQNYDDADAIPKYVVQAQWNEQLVVPYPMSNQNTPEAIPASPAPSPQSFPISPRASTSHLTNYGNSLPVGKSNPGQYLQMLYSTGSHGNYSATSTVSSSANRFLPGNTAHVTAVDEMYPIPNGQMGGGSHNATPLSASQLLQNVDDRELVDLGLHFDPSVPVVSTEPNHVSHANAAHHSVTMNGSFPMPQPGSSRQQMQQPTGKTEILRPFCKCQIDPSSAGLKRALLFTCTDGIRCFMGNASSVIIGAQQLVTFERDGELFVSLGELKSKSLVRNPKRFLNLVQFAKAPMILSDRELEFLISRQILSDKKHKRGISIDHLRWIFQTQAGESNDHIISRIAKLEWFELKLGHWCPKVAYLKQTEEYICPICQKVELRQKGDEIKDIACANCAVQQAAQAIHGDQSDMEKYKGGHIEVGGKYVCCFKKGDTTYVNLHHLSTYFNGYPWLSFYKTVESQSIKCVEAPHSIMSFFLSRSYNARLLTGAIWCARQDLKCIIWFCLGQVNNTDFLAKNPIFQLLGTDQYKEVYPNPSAQKTFMNDAPVFNPASSDAGHGVNQAFNKNWGAFQPPFVLPSATKVQKGAQTKEQVTFLESKDHLPKGGRFSVIENENHTDYRDYCTKKQYRILKKPNPPSFASGQEDLLSIAAKASGIEMNERGSVETSSIRSSVAVGNFVTDRTITETTTLAVSTVGTMKSIVSDVGPMTVGPVSGVNLSTQPSQITFEQEQNQMVSYTSEAEQTDILSMPNSFFDDNPTSAPVLCPKSVEQIVNKSTEINIIQNERGERFQCTPICLVDELDKHIDRMNVTSNSTSGTNFQTPEPKTSVDTSHPMPTEGNLKHSASETNDAKIKLPVTTDETSVNDMSSLEKLFQDSLDELQKTADRVKTCPPAQSSNISFDISDSDDNDNQNLSILAEVADTASPFAVEGVNDTASPFAVEGGNDVDKPAVEDSQCQNNMMQGTPNYAARIESSCRNMVLPELSDSTDTAQTCEVDQSKEAYSFQCYIDEEKSMRTGSEETQDVLSLLIKESKALEVNNNERTHDSNIQVSSNISESKVSKPKTKHKHKKRKSSTDTVDNSSKQSSDAKPKDKHKGLKRKLSTGHAGVVKNSQKRTKSTHNDDVIVNEVEIRSQNKLKAPKTLNKKRKGTLSTNTGQKKKAKIETVKSSHSDLPVSEKEQECVNSSVSQKKTQQNSDVSTSGKECLQRKSEGSGCVDSKDTSDTSDMQSSGKEQGLHVGSDRIRCADSNETTKDTSKDTSDVTFSRSSEVSENSKQNNKEHEKSKRKKKKKKHKKKHEKELKSEKKIVQKVHEEMNEKQEDSSKTENLAKNNIDESHLRKKILKNVLKKVEIVYMKETPERGMQFQLKVDPSVYKVYGESDSRKLWLKEKLYSLVKIVYLRRKHCKDKKQS